MRTYVKETDTRYFVNKEKGTVVCLLDIEVDLMKVLDYYDRYEILAERKIINVFKKHGFSVNNISNGVVTITVRGKTKVQGDDVFDEKKGKTIALTKAQTEAFKKCYKVLDGVMTVIERTLTLYLLKMSAGCRIAYENGLKHVAELSNETNSEEKCSTDTNETND